MQQASRFYHAKSIMLLVFRLENLSMTHLSALLLCDKAVINLKDILLNGIVVVHLCVTHLQDKLIMRQYFVTLQNGNKMNRCVSLLLDRQSSNSKKKEKCQFKRNTLTKQ